MKSEFDEQHECKQCHELYELGDGLEPTDYCNTCAQELVATLRTRLQEAEWLLGEVGRSEQWPNAYLIVNMAAHEWIRRRDAWLKGVKL